MQSFKQYLTEGQTNKLTLIIGLTLENDITAETFTKAEQIIKNEFPKIKLFLNLTKDSITIDVLEMKSSDCNTPNLENISEKIISEVKYCGENMKFKIEEHIYVQLSSEGVPTAPISFEEIVLDANKNDTLTGIEKNIKAFTLYLRQCEHISGGVLSLLKMTDVTEVYLEGTNCGWMEIVQKHLDGDGDILECQEELIEAGFKEYAKL
jgi:hypothetical protein